MRKTKRRLKDRFKEHRRPLNIPTPSSRPATISGHFLPNHHASNDVGLIPLKLKHTSRDAQAKVEKRMQLTGINT